VRRKKYDGSSLDWVHIKNPQLLHSYIYCKFFLLCLKVIVIDMRLCYSSQWVEINLSINISNEHII